MKKTAFQTSTILFCLIVLATGVKGQSLPAVTSGTLRLWLKTDTGVIADGNGFVSQWTDQSSFGNDCTQNDSNQQPVLVPGAFNGQAVIRFDGIQDSTVGDYLQGPADLNVSAGYTSFLVYKRTDNATGERMPLLFGVPGSYYSVRSHFIPNNANNMAFSAWGHDAITGFLIPTNIYRIWTLRMNDTLTSLDFFDTDSDSNYTTSVAMGGLGLPAAGYYVGGLGSQARNFKGDIAEILVYDAALSETDRSAVANYILNKYWSVPPFITSEPQSQNVAAGTNAVFNVVAGSVTAIHYQWYFNETNALSATNATLTISNVQPVNAGNYHVVVTNELGATTSSVAQLTVTLPIVITAQPQSLEILAGSNVTFSISVTGDLPQFQWRWNGAAITDATNATLSLTNVQTTNVGSYSVVVTNSVSAVLSSNAALNVDEPPVIGADPVGGTVLAGEIVSLAVGMQGAAPQVNSGALRLWLKADAGVVQNGGQVAQWIDQSAFANSCSQTNSNQQPLSVAAALNGRPVVRFDGVQDNTTGDFLQATSSLNLTGGFTSFLTYKRTDNLTTEKIPLFIGAPGNSSAARSHYILNNQMAFSGWANDRGSGFQIPTNTYRIWTLRLSSAKTLLGFFDTDNVSNFTNSTAINSLATPAAGYYVGGLGSQTRNFKGDIAELMVYDAALTEGDRVTVEKYLRDRYFGVAGGGAFHFQWSVNGTNVPGATNSSLTLTNFQPEQAGNYLVTVTNLAGSATSQVAVVRALYIFPKVSGQRLTSSAYTYTNSVTVSFESYFTNGVTFYTLDGSTPTFASQYYTGSFVLSNTAILRAITFNSDFTKSGLSDPVTLNVIPLYSLTTSTPGGGKITVSPTPGPYLNGTNVTISATASNGWTFLGWLGDLSGTNLTNTVTMTRNKSVFARFGTAFSATTPGGGTIQLTPAFTLYPYGTPVRLTAMPQAGNFFSLWINAASGSTNPLNMTITNANATASAIFSALGVNQFTLTLLAHGGGQASVSPRSNSYTSGQALTLTATPDAGQSFTGWSGDAGGTQNPLGLNLTANKTITANFTGGPLLSASNQSDGLRIRMTNLVVGQYSIQISSNLVDWSSLLIFTNPFGTYEFTDPSGTNLDRRFYRTMEIQP